MEYGHKSVILQGVMGSHAYGLNHAESDIDTFGIYVDDARMFWGLRGVTKRDLTVVRHEPADLTMHEVGKYCNLALQCNPTVLEFLWRDEFEIETYWGEQLVMHRKAFLSERVRDSFGGYAMQQARRLERRHAEGKKGFSSDTQARTAKHARHCFRLLRQGTELLQTGGMHLMIEPEARAELFELGDLPVAEIVARFEREFESFSNVRSVLPAKPNDGLIERLLQRLRLYYFHQGQADGLINAA